VESTSDADAMARLADVEPWLRRINESVAASVLEAFEEWLTRHRLLGPAWLRKTRRSTNPMASRCSTVRDGEGHLARDRDSTRRQRGVAAVLKTPMDVITLGGRASVRDAQCQHGSQRCPRLTGLLHPSVGSSALKT